MNVYMNCCPPMVISLVVEGGDLATVGAHELDVDRPGVEQGMDLWPKGDGRAAVYQRLATSDFIFNNQKLCPGRWS